MAIDWRLKEVLESQGIPNAPRLKVALEERLGVQLSRISLDKLLNKTPHAVRLETVQFLCNLLQLPLEAFLTVTPEPIIKHPDGPYQPYGKQNKPTESLIIDPGAFF